MAYTQEQQYWIWLASVSRLGPRRFEALLAQGCRPQEVWETFGPWMRPVLGAEAYRSLEKARDARYFDQLFSSLERSDAVAITREDPEYPPRLREAADAPLVLYVRGRVTLADAHPFAIVGARQSSAYGTRMARQIARELSQAGVTVVSGLARGIDGAAHQGAIDAQARTIAVLGSGVDVIYPPDHLTLAQEILNAGGSIISEQPLGAAPYGNHFPLRNRIISGMSEGLLLVEAAKKSGTMSTVHYANDQGRTVFALPGQASSALSAMPHALIRDGAILATCARDILEDLHIPTKIGAQDRPHYATQTLPLSLREQRLYNLLAGGPMDTDAIVEALELSPPEVNSLLTILEIQGIIRKLPDRKVERIEMEDK